MIDYSGVYRAFAWAVLLLQWGGWYLFVCLIAGVPVFSTSTRNKVIVTLVAVGLFVLASIRPNINTLYPPPLSSDVFFFCVPVAGLLTGLALVAVRTFAVLRPGSRADQEARPLRSWWKEVLIRLAPTDQEARPLLSWWKEVLIRFAPIMLVPLVAVAGSKLPPSRAYERAQRRPSMSNMREIINACWTRAGEDGLGWPDDLRTLVEEGYLKEDVLRNPRQPEREVGYVYLKPVGPDERIWHLSTTVVLYEAYERWPKGGLLVGAADRRVHVVEEEAQFTPPSIEPWW